MESFSSDDLQKVVLKPATSASFSELLNSNTMELFHNHLPSLGSHVHGLLDYFPNMSFPNTTQPYHHSNDQLQFSSHQSTTFGPVPSIVEGDFGIDRNTTIKTGMPVSEFSEMPSSPGLGSESGGNNRTDGNSLQSAKKRKRKMEGEVEKPKEVIHVRAKRGQATDSHSLAERVRRERINEKLRVLQDLVPGCYKTMGMAVMLDVIINYVRSLQNQIEFLSMKLSAASLFYDFNSPEAEALETLQRTSNPIYEVDGMHQKKKIYEVDGEMEKMSREEYRGSMPEAQVHSTWPF